MFRIGGCDEKCQPDDLFRRFESPGVVKQSIYSREMGDFAPPFYLKHYWLATCYNRSADQKTNVLKWFPVGRPHSIN
jgi:hypothetical protein